MSLHISPPSPPDLVDTLAVWRARFPRFAEMIDAGESPVKALRYLGLGLWQEGDVTGAVAALTTAASLTPEDAALLADLGAVLWLDGRKADALACFIASIERDPNRVQPWLTVAGLCNEIGEITTAEHAYRAALDLDPASAEAATGLGLICLESRRYDEAVALLRAALERGVSTPALDACYGQTLFLIGEFAAARAAFERAAEALPDEAPIIRKYALAAFVEAALDEAPEQAFAAYRRAAGVHAESDDRIGRSVFQALCGFGHKAAAIRFGEALLRAAPEDQIIPFHLDALRGRRHERASRAYIAACFDKYAPDFDRHLVETLGYRLPETLQPLLAATGRAFPRILDLGCGTGLAAKMLASFGEEIIGVDLSPRMLDKARERQIYARLIEQDIEEFLPGSGERFDLVVALDMVIYLGDLAALFAGVGARLVPGGVFAFSFETGAGADYALAPAGRFAHDPAYIEKLWEKDFVPLVSQATTIRIEANRPVDGRLVLLRRREAL
ncbi:methyltransferase domain-containing protein [Methylosinus sp. H3A]|uniref:methyltransferase domain-containing protein n=1 Tax=Methylosinus sp. H3A TaxID=2785786 RepID=UPI0018C34628|nr:methyltransferase domain-containing protein [Methylosinus sp. H3A]MBG0812084.1 methyltransferase domain-containing protein [Methylosinus sp. H3A]